MTPLRYVKRTVITPPSTAPKQKTRSSFPLWERSAAMTRLGSAKANCAIENATPCFRRFATSFAGSHSKPVRLINGV